MVFVKPQGGDDKCRAMQALVLIENKASQRVLEKLGFHMEGLLRKYTIHKGIVKDVFISILGTFSNFLKFMVSSRISLRPFKVSNTDDFLKWTSDDKVMRYLRWNTTTSSPYVWMAIRLDMFQSSPNRTMTRVEPMLAMLCLLSTEGQGIAKQALRMGRSREFKEFPCLVRIEGSVWKQSKFVPLSYYKAKP
ncbi:hypothetical protein TB2_021739 [Malus domestica]